MWSKKCHAKPSNLTSESLTIIRQFYKRDFDVFRKAKKQFGQLIREGMVSPQIPDLCPKGQECRRNEATCAYKGCRVPWLDMDVGDDYKCITVGCDPRSQKRWVKP